MWCSVQQKGHKDIAGFKHKVSMECKYNQLN